MPITELAEWAQLYAEEPFGDARGDLQAAIIACTTARALGGNKQAKVADFLPRFITPAPEPEPAPLEAQQLALPLKPVRRSTPETDAETARLMAIFDAGAGRNKSIVLRRTPKPTTH